MLTQIGVLNAHECRHTEQHDECQNCGKSFPHKEEHSCHVKQQAGHGKTLKNELGLCQMCDKSFAEEVSFPKHRNKHETYETCGAIFEQKQHVEMHKNVHRENKEHEYHEINHIQLVKCSLCQQVFDTQTQVSVCVSRT